MTVTERIVATEEERQNEREKGERAKGGGGGVGGGRIALFQSVFRRLLLLQCRREGMQIETCLQGS